MLFAVPDAFVCDDPDGPGPGLQPRRDQHLLPQSSTRQRDGHRARRQPTSPTGPTSGGTLRRQHRQLLVPEHAATSRSPAAPRTCSELQQRPEPGQSIATLATNPRRRRAARLPGRDRQGPDPNSPTCDWFRDPAAADAVGSSTAPRADCRKVPGHDRSPRSRPLPRAFSSASSQVAGCGGGSDASNSAAGAGPDLGVPLRLADCDDWNQADVSERLGTFRSCSNFAGGPTGSPAGHGTMLSTKRAYNVLRNWCQQSFAHGFKLYKLYTRAAAFRQPSLAPADFGCRRPSCRS